MRRGLASLGFACLTASLVLGSCVLHGRRPAADEWPDPDVAARRTVGVEVLEERYSPGFPEVAALASEAPDAPTWESFRRLLEVREDVDLWYSFKVRWLLDDGGGVEVTYLRRPYLTASEFTHFLRFVREGRMDPLESWSADSRPLRGGYLKRTPLAAAIVERAARREPGEAVGGGRFEEPAPR